MTSPSVILARRTGQPILLFHIAVEKAYTFEKSWDLFQVPHLFSRAVVVIAPPVYVAPPPLAQTITVHQTVSSAGGDDQGEAGVGGDD